MSNRATAFHPATTATVRRLAAGAVLAAIAATVVGGTTGCTSTGIAIREQLGYAKREQLVDRVEDARDSQGEAREQFVSTLDRFKAITGHDGGELEKLYRDLNRELERSRDRAEEVSRRIDSVEDVAKAMFREWEAELDEYSSAELRRASEGQLTVTRTRYEQLLAAMRRAESSMEPVLVALGDQVLFLKHNLNARAIASLDQVSATLEAEVGALINDMNRSIAEADAFIAQMGEAP